MPRPKKRNPSPLATLPSKSARGDGTLHTHWWVAPELEAEPAQAPVEPQVEAEPAEPTRAAENAPDAFDEAKAELEKANNEVNHLLTLYGDSEFDSQWCQPGFVMRVKERLAAAESKLLQAETTYLEAFIAPNSTTEDILKALKIKFALTRKEREIIVAHKVLIGLMREERDSLVLECS